MDLNRGNFQMCLLFKEGNKHVGLKISVEHEYLELLNGCKFTGAFALLLMS